MPVSASRQYRHYTGYRHYWGLHQHYYYLYQQYERIPAVSSYCTGIKKEVSTIQSALYEDAHGIRIVGAFVDGLVLSLLHT